MFGEVIYVPSRTLTSIEKNGNILGYHVYRNGIDGGHIYYARAYTLTTRTTSKRGELK